MNSERVFLSEVERYGEKVCVIRDCFEQIPPEECGACWLLRFCEKQRTDEDIERLMDMVRRSDFRSTFFAQMWQDGYYD